MDTTPNVFAADATTTITTGGVIKPCHIVLGDTHASNRTTLATEILRDVKEIYKGRYKNRNRNFWIPKAREEFNRRLQEVFPEESERGRVLIKCTDKTVDRTRVANVYRYAEDAEPTYGLAHTDVALNFFLVSGDSPTLKRELERHWNNLEQTTGWDDNDGGIPALRTNTFVKTLSFFHERWEEANDGDVFSEKLIEVFRPIPKLGRLWNLLSRSGNDDAVIPPDQHSLHEHLHPYHWKRLVRDRIKLFRTKHGGSGWMPRKQQPFLSTESEAALGATLNLYEQGLRRQHHYHDNDDRKMPGTSHTGPFSSLGTLKKELDKQWKDIALDDDDVTCSTSQDSSTCDVDEDELLDFNRIFKAATPLPHHEKSFWACRQASVSASISTASSDTTQPWHFSDAACRTVKRSRAATGPVARSTSPNFHPRHHPTPPRRHGSGMEERSMHMGEVFRAATPHDKAAQVAEIWRDTAGLLQERAVGSWTSDDYQRASGSNGNTDDSLHRVGDDPLSASCERFMSLSLSSSMEQLMHPPLISSKQKAEADLLCDAVSFASFADGDDDDPDEDDDIELLQAEVEIEMQLSMEQANAMAKQARMKPPPRNTTLEKWLQAHYQIVDREEARTFAREIMKQVPYVEDRVFDKDIEHASVQFAQVRGLLPKYG